MLHLRRGKKSNSGRSGDFGWRRLVGGADLCFGLGLGLLAMGLAGIMPLHAEEPPLSSAGRLYWVRFQAPPLFLEAKAGAPEGYGARIEAWFRRRLTGFRHHSDEALIPPTPRERQRLQQLLKDRAGSGGGQLPRRPAQRRDALCGLGLDRLIPMAGLVRSQPLLMIHTPRLAVRAKDKARFLPHKRQGGIDLASLLEEGALRSGMPVLAREPVAALVADESWFLRARALLSRGRPPVRQDRVPSLLSSLADGSLDYVLISPSEGQWGRRQAMLTEYLAYLPLAGQPHYVPLRIACAQTATGQAAIDAINRLRQGQGAYPIYMMYYERWLDDDSRRALWFFMAGAAGAA